MPWALDLRSLAAFRIALGIAIVFDVVDRARALSLYTHDAPVPLEFLDGPLFWTLYSISDAPAFVVTLFVIHGALALVFAAGRAPRLTAALLFVLTVSIQARTPLSLFSGDTLYRALLVWSLFLPLDRRFVLGGAHGEREKGPATSSSLACAVLVAQVFMFLFCAGVAKLWSSGWRDGTALERILATNFYATELGARAAEVAGPAALLAATWGSLVVEIVLPVLLLVPRARVRLAAMLGVAALMVGISLFMAVGLFPMLAIVALVPFTPSRVWDPGAARDDVGASSGVFGDTSSRAGRLVIAVLGAVMFTSSALNAAHVDVKRVTPPLVSATGLVQHWAMFSTPESMDLTWPHIVGPRVDDAAVSWDVLYGYPARPDEVPPPLAATPLSFRERRVIEALWITTNQALLPHVARWMCTLAPVSRVTVHLAHVVDGGNARYARLVEADCPRTR